MVHSDGEVMSLPTQIQAGWAAPRLIDRLQRTTNAVLHKNHSFVYEILILADTSCRRTLEQEDLQEKYTYELKVRPIINMILLKGDTLIMNGELGIS